MTGEHQPEEMTAMLEMKAKVEGWEAKPETFTQS
jgi:hypothetical protein